MWPKINLVSVEENVEKQMTTTVTNDLTVALQDVIITKQGEQIREFI